MPADTPEQIRQLCEKLATSFGEYGMGLTLLAPEKSDSGGYSFSVVTYGRDIPLPQMEVDGAYSIAFRDPEEVAERRNVHFHLHEGREKDFRVYLDTYGDCGRDYKLWAAIAMALDDNLDYPSALGQAQHFLEGWPEGAVDNYMDVSDYRMVGELSAWMENGDLDSVEFVYLPDIWNYYRGTDSYTPMRPEWIEDANMRGVLCNLEGVVTEIRKENDGFFYRTYINVDCDDGTSYLLHYSFTTNPFVFIVGERYFFEGTFYDGSVSIERAQLADASQ
jgi:hypothetical protein